ncbi:hypothetical protein MHYP_G00252650 [Metynnis hypsauchen]
MSLGWHGNGVRRKRPLLHMLRLAQRSRSNLAISDRPLDRPLQSSRNQMEPDISEAFDVSTRHSRLDLNAKCGKAPGKRRYLREALSAAQTELKWQIKKGFSLDSKPKHAKLVPA